MKKLALWTLPLLILGTLLLAACGSGATTKEPSRQTARDYVTGSPTYVFDGIPETLKLTVETVLTEDVAYTFVYEFDSRHAGYGDRTGQALAQVITHHKAVITVENGEVTAAVMDGAWDMQAQTEPVE